MCSYGVSDIGTGAGEEVDWMANGVGTTPGSVAWSGASGDGSIMGAETSVHNELAEVGEFVESDKGRFDEEVLGLMDPRRGCGNPL